jgi:hypothetical protein
VGFQPGIEPGFGLGVTMRKWEVFKSSVGGDEWWATPSTTCQGLELFRTHREAFDYAFTEATRELSDR